MNIVRLLIRSLLQVVVGALIALGVTDHDAQLFSSAAEPVVLALALHLSTVVWSIIEKRNLLKRIGL